MSTSLTNHLLIAMPSLTDPNFEHSVIYICEHHAQGTVGLIINRPLNFSLSFVLQQMQIESHLTQRSQDPILFGGPLQPERGFVIHRPSGKWRSSLLLNGGVTVTTSNDIIRAISEDKGPQDSLITLGYSGWLENQLELEVRDNVWLVCPYKSELLYEVPYEKRWEYAGLSIGVKMSQLSSESGHA